MTATPVPFDANRVPVAPWFRESYLDPTTRYAARNHGGEWCSVRQTLRDGRWWSDLSTQEPARSVLRASEDAGKRARNERRDGKAAA